jgi:hypothetical protein
MPFARRTPFGQSAPSAADLKFLQLGGNLE